jgi:hypothetical protein
MATAGIFISAAFSINCFIRTAPSRSEYSE